ncbi:Ras subfamily protein [Acanthamoeba castellanii str. Neff]|uniref:Ras subfamily protein n=1 Tax=Acanthamoeba castellanii (strain ATCC 30010 / Neff) TaxID=1257118 RepID=L8GWU2_ACACF|nr:Ras subfamily protein [Acanthamoeba castellanii str. Neff]ELR16556.1 Ras subfamily protein [Acanthamoeba castellanii str. Neff]
MQEQAECTTTAKAAAGEAFLEAVAAGDVLRVRQLLREHPPNHVVDAVDHLGWTGLMVAVEARHVEMVELLLASGADPHHRSSVDGMHALHVLAEQSQRRVCRFMSSHTWHLAKAAERVLLQALLDAGVDPNVPTTSSGETVVHLMCLRGNIEGVRELLARRLVVDIDARNAHGDTALHYAILMFAASAFSAAARRGHDEVARLLVAHGASRAVEGRFGTSAQAAIEFGQHHIVQRLRALALRNEDAQQLVLSRLPPEVVVHVLSFVANADDLCSLSMASRALAAVSRDDALWKPLGHPSWADHHALREGSAWKGAYMLWLRAAVSHGVGKSAILRRYVQGAFEVARTPSVTQFERRHVEWHDNRIELHLWDPSGRERFRSISPIVFHNAHGAVVVYDIADRSTFDCVTLWMEEIRRKGPEGMAVVLAGNKADLASTKRAVTEREGR